MTRKIGSYVENILRSSNDGKKYLVLNQPEHDICAEYPVQLKVFTNGLVSDKEESIQVSFVDAKDWGKPIKTPEIKIKNGRAWIKFKSFKSLWSCVNAPKTQEVLRQLYDQSKQNEKRLAELLNNIRSLPNNLIDSFARDALLFKLSKIEEGTKSSNLKVAKFLKEGSLEKMVTTSAC
jgi:hypothetical protein